MSETVIVAPGKQRIVLLDALRLLAAVTVVCFHWFFRGPASGEQVTQIPVPENIAMYGYIGVDWFFIISGFVIAWTAEGRTALQFAIARFTRIYPAFIICMSLTFMGTLYFQPHFATVSVKDWIENLFIFAPLLGSKFMDGAYWSIVIELIFYAWVFILLLVGVFERHRLAISITWLIIALLNQHLIHSAALRLIAATEFVPWFIMGMMLHEMWKKSISIKPLLILAAAFYASCLTLLDQLPIFVNQYGEAPKHEIVLALNVLGVVLVVLCINAAPTSRICTKSAGLAGALSYPLYLLHQHLGYMLIDWLAPIFGGVPAFLLTFVTITSAAGAIAFVIEPIIQRKLTICLIAITHGRKIVAPVVFRPSRLR